MFRPKRLPALAKVASVVGLTLALAAMPSETATAQAKSKEPVKPTEQVKSERPAAPRVLIPDSQGLAILIHNSIIALSQANLTGNYSVLRDLAAPEFQKLNSTKRLANIFENMRARDLNLSQVVLYQPKLARPPTIDDHGFLRITGFYETQPLQIHFHLVFQPFAGIWRLFEISVVTAVGS
jgi:hypothetical protein